MYNYTGFVYIWRDRKNKMFYIGSHMGKLDDGYIGSNCAEFSGKGIVS